MAGRTGMHTLKWYKAVCKANASKCGIKQSRKWVKKRLALAAKGWAEMSPEDNKLFRRRVSKVVKACWANMTVAERKARGASISAGWRPSSRKAQGVRMSKLRAFGLSQRPTRIEHKMKKLLNLLGVRYSFCKPLFGFIPDFVLPDFRIVIECNGLYWHSMPTVKRRDRRKYWRFQKEGYKVLVFTDRQLYRSTGKVIKRIKLAIGRTR